MSKPLFGGIEGGGTKFVCAVGTDPNSLLAETRIETTSPEETMKRVVDFFEQQETVFGKLSAIGFACFGPLELNPNSPTFGHILATPKPGWMNANVIGLLHGSFDIPIAFDTDVNGAALGEGCWGAAQGLDTFLYLTIGTGIGGGAFVEGKLLHGLLHPEMGHVFVKHDVENDPFEGICPFHGDCFEGLACGGAMEKRWGQRADALPPEHPAWSLQADYIAQALVNYTMTLSPQRIILGGGVGSVPHLLPKVQQRTRELINGFLSSVNQKNIESYIVHPGLGNRAGVLGAIALAEQLNK